MLLYLILSLIAALLFGFRLIPLLQPIADFLQSACVLRFKSEEMQAFAGALVCGKEIDSPATRALLIDTGVYHALVVSGAHLTFLTLLLIYLWSKTPWPAPSGWRRFLLVLPLTGFAFMSGLQAPVIRALVHWVIAQKQGQDSPPLQIMRAHFISLVLNPDWSTSLSLNLSSLAMLSVHFARHPFKQACVVYLVLSPVLFFYSPPSLLAIPSGFVFSALIEVLLFPLCLVAWLVTPLQDLAEFFVRAVLRLLVEVQALTPTLALNPRAMPKYFLPFYLGLVWWLCDYVYSARHRRWSFACRSL